jgi:hypothetical protein
MNEVVVAPAVRVSLHAPLLVSVEVSEVVALGHEELLSGRVRLFLAVLGAEEDAGHGQHRHDHEDLGCAVQALGEDELREARGVRSEE